MLRCITGREIELDFSVGISRVMCGACYPNRTGLRGKELSRYRVIDLVDDRYPEQTLTTVTDEDAAVIANRDGTPTLKYTEKLGRPETP